MGGHTDVQTDVWTKGGHMSLLSEVTCISVLQYSAGQSCIRLIHQILTKKREKKKNRKNNKNHGNEKEEKTKKVFHHRPKFAMCFLSRTYFNLLKFVSCIGTGPEGLVCEK